MDTPALLPCPFCGATDDDNSLRRVIDGEWENCWIECDKCGAQGPHVAMQQLRIDDISDEDFIKAKNLADDEASAAAATAWNQRSAWQPIATAPGGGTEVFVWDGAKAVVVVSEHDFFGDVIHWPIDEWGDKRRDQPPVHGTHWQPLPSPPPITP